MVNIYTYIVELSLPIEAVLVVFSLAVPSAISLLEITRLLMTEQMEPARESFVLECLSEEFDVKLT